ncbi:MAG: ABC transporter ATP-binding protein, partial [bacterium]
VIENRLSIGDFVTFNGYLAMLIWPMMAVGFAVSLYQRGMASFSRIQALLKDAPEPSIVSEAPAPATSLRVDSARGRVEFRNLTFSYGDGPPALHDMSLTLEPGEKLAIVGRTGCGKSSVIGLLSRLYNPPHGTVLIDGQDVLTVPLNDLRSLIAVIPQESFLFSDTLRGNIAFGKPDASFEQVQRAARIAEVEGEILSFPAGYDTPVGERGVTLSGGQRQRVALARAILRSPKILILDDALSAVDAETERRILGHLEEVLESRTSIVITHRISAIRDFHKIAVLDIGQLTEFGDHETLMRRNGIYARLYQLQAMEERFFKEAEALAQADA